MDETTTTTQAGPDVDASGAQAGLGTGNSGDDKVTKKYSEEAAEWRTKYRTAETELKTLREKYSQLEHQISDPAATDSKGELATLQRNFNDLESKLKAAEEKSKAAEDKVKNKTLQAALSSIAASAQLTDTASAMELLQKRSKVADDDAVVFVVTEDGKDKEVEATVENLKKYSLLPAIYFPAEGVSGSGAKPSTKVAATAVDLSKAKDFAYFKQNYSAIKAAQRASRKA